MRESPYTPLLINGVTGSVSAVAAILAGTGFTVAHPGAGVYTVTFTTALSAAPVVVVTVNSAAAGLFATADLVVAGSFRVVTWNSFTTAGDEPFNFLAFVPQ